MHTSNPTIKPDHAQVPVQPVQPAVQVPAAVPVQFVAPVPGPGPDRSRPTPPHGQPQAADPKIDQLAKEAADRLRTGQV